MLPDGFHRIRHYGLFANGHRAEKLALCRKLLAVPSTSKGADEYDIEDASGMADDPPPCPCCGGSFRAFRPRDGRPEARCPRCNSYERHRVLWMWLRDRGGLAGAVLDMLHVAPEPVLEHVLKAVC